MTQENPLESLRRLAEAITKDEPGKIRGIEIRSNIRDRFCEGQECPLRKVLGKLADIDLMDSRRVKNICREAGLKPGNPFYGHGLPTEVQTQVGQFVFTADCVKHAGDKEYANYTNCGSLMITDLRFKSLPQARATLTESIRAQWVLNNSDFTNPPKK